MKSHCVVLILACLSSAALGAGDPQRGARLFGQCAACHSVEEGEHMTGPSLAHAWNHKAGTAKGFMRYSDAVKHSEANWDEATLDKWLRNPALLIPGNSMALSGVREAKDRADLIAYLKAVDENKAPTPTKAGGMMDMHGRRLDLKNAPPAGQVRSIKYCGDTYTLETGDGKTEKIWEFNLRFKSDSSKLGPARGKPVVVGAGMRGDRASIIFASSREISEAIKLSCP